MKFGLFIIGDSDPELGHDLKGYYERMLEQVRWGESLGYECFWFGEHHFDFHGVIPSPTVLMSAAAACTRYHPPGRGGGAAALPGPGAHGRGVRHDRRAQRRPARLRGGARHPSGAGRLRGQGGQPGPAGGEPRSRRDGLAGRAGVLSGTVPPHRRRIPERAPGPAALAAGVLRRPEPRLLPGGGGEGLPHHGHPLRELQGHGRGQAQGGFLQGDAVPVRPRPRGAGRGPVHPHPRGRIRRGRPTPRPPRHEPLLRHAQERAAPEATTSSTGSAC